MLRFVLESFDAETGRYVYIFYPEGNQRPGRVAHLPNGEREIIEQSPDDFKGFYLTHALWGIKTGQEKGTVAWY